MFVFAKSFKWGFHLVIYYIFYGQMELTITK